MIKYIKSIKSETKAVLIGSIAASLITLLGTLGGVYLQSQLTLNQNAEAEFRKERKIAYTEFRDNANRYDVQAQILKDCIITQNKDRTSDSILTCPNALTLVNARYMFQGSVNDMYIYGTKESINIVRLIASNLPNSLAKYSDKNGVPPYDEIIDHKTNSINTGYDMFQDIMCKDLRPSDTNICNDR